MRYKIQYICSRDSEIQKKERNGGGWNALCDDQVEPNLEGLPADDRGDATTVRYGDARHNTRTSNGLTCLV